MVSADLSARLAAHVGAVTAKTVVVESVELLPGGACQENYKVALRLGDAKTETLVLRADSKGSLPGSLDRAGEARVIAAAYAAGVRTPEARWLGRDLTRAGSHAYFLAWVDGEAIGRKVVKAEKFAAARLQLADQLAAELAKIHSITPQSHPDLFPVGVRPSDRDPATLDPVRVILDDLGSSLDALTQLGRPRPALELALSWLRAHAPQQSEVTLVHGDFRVGNFMVTDGGLEALLDWEFARWGTPAEDLSWISLRDWRFGKLDLPVGGFSSRTPFYAAYERHSGRKLDRQELHYWEVLGNVRWAVGSLYQGRRYADGERDIELIAVAHRATEMEYEALRLIAPVAGDTDA